jgi:hypothetical protein
VLIPKRSPNIEEAQCFPDQQSKVEGECKKHRDRKQYDKRASPEEHERKRNKKSVLSSGNDQEQNHGYT